MGRAHLGDLAVFRVRCATGLKVFDNDPLVGHDLKKHIGGHDRRRESAEMQQRRPAGENLVVSP